MPLIPVHVPPERMDALAKVIVGEIMRSGSFDQILPVEEGDIFTMSVNGRKAHVRWESLYSVVTSLLNGNRDEILREKTKEQIVRFLVLGEQSAIGSSVCEFITDLVLFGSPQRRSERVEAQE